MAKSIDERYELLEKTVGKITEISKDLAAAGTYNKNDAEHLAHLLLRVTDVMSILDPDRAQRYFASIAEGFTPEAQKQYEKVYDAFKTGLYL